MKDNSLRFVSDIASVSPNDIAAGGWFQKSNCTRKSINKFLKNFVNKVSLKRPKVNGRSSETRNG